MAVELKKEDKSMKKMIHDIHIMAALLMASAAFTACSTDDDLITEQPQEQTPKTYTITVQATKDLDTTRGLELSGNELNSVWEVGEKVKVVQSNASDEPTCIGELTAQTAGKYTTLTGTVDGTFDPSKELTFYLHDTTFDFSGQDGTLATLGQSHTYGYCQKTTSEISVSGSTVTINGGLTFANAQSIVRFNLVDKATGDPINATSLTVYDASGKLIQKADQLDPSSSGLVRGDVAIALTSASNTVFASLSGINSSNLTLYASDGKNLYTYTKSGVTFTNGNYYQVQVKMTKKCSVGDVILSDGSFAAPGTAGAVAMVAYLGNDAGNATYNRGLAIALTDESSGTLAWSENLEELAGVSCSTDFSDHIGFLNGIADTETLNTKYSGYAATKAKNYAVAAPTGTSGWFLPSSGQWMKFFEAAGVDIYGWEKADNIARSKGGAGDWTKLSTLLEAAAPGSSPMEDSGRRHYWTSSEYSERYAYFFMFHTTMGIEFGYWRKSISNSCHVRPFLAF